VATPRRTTDPVERAISAIRSQGTSPSGLASAPGRVNLIGEHVDHRGGVVLPFAIDRRIAVAAAPAIDGRTRIIAADLGRAWSCDGPPPSRRIDAGPDAFANHVLGMIASLPNPSSSTLPPLVIAIAGDLPIGAGMSSSAALEVATGLAVSQALELETPDVASLAVAARRAEHEFVGTPCGIMDMLASAAGRAGHVLRIDCDTHATTVLPAPDPHGAVFAVIDSGVRHRLADGGYAARLAALDRVERHMARPLRASTLDEIEALSIDAADRRLARHVVTEMSRVADAETALRMNDPRRLGRLLFDSHVSLRTDFAVSVAEIDAIVTAARERRDAGVFGARMIGGGFGGVVLLLLDRTRSADLLSEIAGEIAPIIGRRPTPIIVEPSDGARLESTDDGDVSYPRGRPVP
jgi:galactokinase